MSAREISKGHYGLGWDVIPEDYFSSGLVRIAHGMYESSDFHLEYHDWYHIVELTETARYHNISLSREQALALLFHDCVYVPGAPAEQNELASELKLRHMAYMVKDVDVNLACAIIMDTAKHVPSKEESRLVLDLDLSPLGDPDPVIFDINDDCIWAENRHLFPADDTEARLAFRLKRAEFAASFLKRDKIFYTEVFAYMEQNARENLQRLVDAATMEYLPNESL